MAKVSMPSKRQTGSGVKKQEPKQAVDPVKEIEVKVEVVKDDGPVFLKVSNCRVLNVRMAPTKDSKIVAVIQNGTILQVDKFSHDSSWLHVIAYGDKSTINPNSKPGYILAEYTSEV